MDDVFLILYIRPLNNILFFVQNLKFLEFLKKKKFFFCKNFLSDIFVYIWNLIFFQVVIKNSPGSSSHSISFFKLSRYLTNLRVTV